MNAFTVRLAIMRGASRAQRIWTALSEGRSYYCPRKSTSRGRKYEKPVQLPTPSLLANG